ncbi:MAG: DUF3047 domain-containing protein [Burkholderiaceae bacterium]
MLILIKFLLLSLLLPLVACSVAPLSVPSALSGKSAAQDALSSAHRVSVAPLVGWQHMLLPGKTPTQYLPTQVDGRVAMAARSEASASMLRQNLRVEPQDLSSVRFSWKVPALMERADLGLRDRADSPVRVVLVFEGDRSQFSMRNSALSELSLALTGEAMPYATLMYVWCNSRPSGSVIVSSRTDRIRKLVVESGKGHLNQWLDYERDVRADFEKAFGEPPGALIGIAIMSDSDNTRSRTEAWYGPVQLGQSLLAKK